MFALPRVSVIVDGWGRGRGLIRGRGRGRCRGRCRGRGRGRGGSRGRGRGRVLIRGRGRGRGRCRGDDRDVFKTKAKKIFNMAPLFCVAILNEFLLVFVSLILVKPVVLLGSGCLFMFVAKPFTLV